MVVEAPVLDSKSLLSVLASEPALSSVANKLQEPEGPADVAMYRAYSPSGDETT